jgi:hypothetical protein
MHVAMLGLCGGFALPLFAKPPQSDRPAATGPAPARPATEEGTIVVRGKPEVRIGGTPAPACAAATNPGQAGCPASDPGQAVRPVQPPAAADPRLAVPNARSGDTRVGVGSLTASSQRLGADLRHRATLPVRRVPPPPKPAFPRQP